MFQKEKENPYHEIRGLPKSSLHMHVKYTLRQWANLHILRIIFTLN